MAKWKFSKHYKAECAAQTWALARPHYRRDATQLAWVKREYLDWYARERMGAAFPAEATVREDGASAVISTEQAQDFGREIMGAYWNGRPIMRKVKVEIARYPLPIWWFSKPEDFAQAFPLEDAPDSMFAEAAE